MIRRFNIHKKEDAYKIVELLRNLRDKDFYYTENNQRRYINSYKDLKSFYKNCEEIYILDEESEITGIIAVWKSLGENNFKRYYVKFTANNIFNAKNLLDVFTWNVYRNVYAKFHKKNKFLKLLYSKDFKFEGGRGQQVLLFRKKRYYPKEGK